MDFIWKGVIKSSKRVRCNNQECYGLTRGQKNKFKVYISYKALENGELYAETMLHELLHLYFYCLMARGVKGLSEAVQHEILEQAIPIVLSRTALILSKRKRK